MSLRACPTVGIDLGTTYSSLAYVDSQLTPRVVSDGAGQTVMPSVVFFDDQDVIVGELALHQARLRADRVVQFIKVHMGDAWRREFQGHVHTPESISAIILGQLVREAEPQIGPIPSAVITVPAYFTERRRRATQQAGEIAGLNVIATLNEPMAATLAYGLYRADDEQVAVVYDLGGGTFDVTVVRISPNELEELATSGNRQLGGRDWDQCLMDYVADGFQRACDHDLRTDPQAWQDLQMECERAKRRLSRLANTGVRVQAFGRDHTVAVSREQFDALTAHLLHATRMTTESALEDAHLSWAAVSRVVLVGGSTHMPAVRGMLRQLSGKPPDTGVNPVLAVSLGAATYAHFLESGQALKAIRQKPVAEPSAAAQPSLVSEPPATVVPTPLPESLKPAATPSIAPLPAVAEPSIPYVIAASKDLPVVEYVAEPVSAPDAATADEPPEYDAEPPPIYNAPPPPILATVVGDDIPEIVPEDLSVSGNERGRIFGAPPIADSQFPGSQFPVAQLPVSHLPAVKFVTAHGVGLKVRSGAGWKNTVLIPKNTPVPVSISRTYSTRNKGVGGTSLKIFVTQGDTPDADLAELLGIGAIDGLPPNQPDGQPVQVNMEFDEHGRVHLHAIYVNTGYALRMQLEIPGGLRADELRGHRQFMETLFHSPTSPSLTFDHHAAIAGLESTEMDDDLDDDSPLLEP